MKGLIYKDLLTLKANGKVYLFIVVFSAFFMFTDRAFMFSCMLSMLILMCPLNTFSADELARWDAFSAALPGGRRAVVRGKYALLLLVLAMGTALAAALDLAVVLWDRDWSALPEMLVATLACAAVGLLLNCILFPLIFRFGTQKSRLILAAVGAMVALGIGLSAGVLGEDTAPFPAAPHPGVLAALAVIVLAAATAASYAISCRIYAKREF